MPVGVKKQNGKASILHCSYMSFLFFKKNGSMPKYRISNNLKHFLY
jgi:hypothetical protein